MHHREIHLPHVLKNSFIVRERDPRGAPVDLDAAPQVVRVELQRGELTVGVTVAPTELEPSLAALPGPERTCVLRDLDGPPAAAELAPLLYVALQRARVWRRSVVVSHDTRLAAAPLQLSALARGELRAAPLDAAMHRLYAACDDDGRALLTSRYVAEATASLARHAEAFAGNSWCRAVHADRLAREQYVAALANTHQYVRYTPRLLARAISVCDDESLRDHFTRHFRGEQKHDRLIEADLRYLDADVEFVVHAMVPWGPTLAFMAVQESMVAFHEDLTCFIAAPFVAEGLAAHVGPTVLAPLAGNIRRWGYREPARATRFLVSHTREDGGDDGHWNATLAVLTRLLRDDTTQQRFLAALHLAADAFTASYDAYADYLTLFTPPLLADP